MLYRSVQGFGQMPDLPGGVPQPVIPGYVTEGVCRGQNLEHEESGKRRGFFYGLVAGSVIALGLTFFWKR